MIRVYLTGGLGNQMFQFAAAYAAAKRNDLPLALDLTWFQAVSKMSGVTKRKFDLDHAHLAGIQIFKPSPTVAYLLVRRNFAPSIKLFQIKGYAVFTEQDPFQYDERIEEVRKKTLLLGNFQAEKYFAPYKYELQTLFTKIVSNSSQYLRLKESIGRKNTVCVHVRRGDYVSNKAAFQTHGVPELSYYKKAMSLIQERQEGLRFYVFSDDQLWTRQQSIWPQGTEFVDDSGYCPLDIMNLLSASEHHVLSNSTFGWWAAWLKEQNGRVLMPDYWLRDRQTADTGLKCESWESIN